jgi:hypothetical protein
MPNLLVVGCGAAIHAVHRFGWTETTLDINAATNPTHIGSITNPAHIDWLKAHYPAHFHCVFFENIPEDIFTSDAVTIMVMNALDQLLTVNGIVRFSTGADGEKLTKQIKSTFLRWGYTVVHQAARDLADATNNLDLAVDEADLDEPFDIQFRKVPAARRMAATV